MVPTVATQTFPQVNNSLLKKAIKIRHQSISLIGLLKRAMLIKKRAQGIGLSLLRRAQIFLSKKGGKNISTQPSKDYQGKIKNLNKTENLPVKDLKQEIEALIDTCSKERKQFYLINLVLDDIVQQIINHNRILTSDQLFQNITDVFRIQLKEIGKTFTRRDYNILLLIKDHKDYNPELVLHQIALTLKNLYKEYLDNEALKLDYNIKSYPEYGQNTETLLKSFQ